MHNLSRSLLAVALLLITLMLNAQSNFELSGQVKDEITRKSLEFCSVAVYNSKDSLITGAVTDNSGFFSVLLDPGTYHLIISFIGYKADTTENIDFSENKFAGIYKLQPSESFLKEFSVKESASESQLDRDVQIVTDKLKAGTSNTKEVLDKLNGVDLDRFSNAIKVDNDAKVIILVDGLEKDQEYIKNLSPDRLKKIEVIRDPGGRYALEGYSAVINIVLKKDYQGTELFASERGMFDLDAKNKNYIFVQNECSSTLNYTYNKINLYGKFSNNINHFNLPAFSRKEFGSGLVIENNPPSDDLLNTYVDEFSNDYTLGADYYVNPKHTISFEGNWSSSPFKLNSTKQNDAVNYFSNDVILNSFRSQSSSGSGNNTQYYSLFYTGKVDEKNSFNSNFTYSHYNNSSHSSYYENSLLQRLEHGTDLKDNTEFYLEYYHIFSSKTSIQFGYGNTWKETGSHFTVNDAASNFNSSDFRNKYYSYFAWQKNKKFGVKFGAAAETSKPIADGQEKNYLIVQPYADIKYKPIEAFDFKLKYRSESNYPTIDQTNPFINIIDQQSVKTGNQFLRPEVTHKISLLTNVLGGFMTIEPYYHFSNNMITESGKLINDSLFEYSYSNIGKYTNYGLEANITIPFGKKVFLQTGLNVFNSSIRFEGTTNHINDWTMDNQLLYVDEKTGAVAGLEYQNNLFKSITAQGYNKSDNDFWILFVQHPFLKQRLNVLFLYFLPINWGVDFEQGSFIHSAGYTESRFASVDFLKNMVMLQVSYRFNKGKFINKTEKNIERQKEKKSKGVL